MRLDARHASLLILCLPSITAALSDSSIDSSKIGSAKDIVEPPNYKSDRDVPTKYAPVDGKDGKPHMGPFVGTDSSSPSDLSDLTPLKGRPHDWDSVDGKEIPKTNDSVMFDKNREHPQEGTTGMEGGVSQKSKAKDAHEAKTGDKLQTQPESPKEKPPMPHSDEQKATGKSKEKEKEKDGKKGKSSEDKEDISYTGLDKPDDLPQKPKQKPPPLPKSANKDHLDVSSPKGDSKPKTQKPIGGGNDEDEEGIIQPFHSFVLSLAMILVSEVGDKTFLVAALMAMKHDRIVVFSAAFSALLVMTVLSAVLGHAVPTLIPRRLTSFAAAALFFVFGGKLLSEGMKMDPNEGVGAEMSEVEQELAEKEKEMGRQQGRNSTDPYAMEMGLAGRRSRSKSRFPSPARSPSSSPTRRRPGSGAFNEFMQGASNLLSLLLSPAWVQTFVMTFLGEWGDRSQIATIAMAAGQDYWWVTLGAMVGHAICTGAAVIGGRAIAGRVSLKVVTVGGAVAFLVFGFIYLIEAFYA